MTEPNFTDRVREHVPEVFELLSFAIPIPRTVLEDWTEEYRLKVQRKVTEAMLDALHRIEMESR